MKLAEDIFDRRGGLEEIRLFINTAGRNEDGEWVERGRFIPIQAQVFPVSIPTLGQVLNQMPGGARVIDSKLFYFNFISDWGLGLQELIHSKAPRYVFYQGLRYTVEQSNYWGEENLVELIGIIQQGAVHTMPEDENDNN